MELPVTSVVSDGERHEITVECGSLYTITEADFLSLGIAQSGVADVEKLAFCAGKLVCIKKAADYLSYGDLSERRLREKLKAKFSPEVISAVIALFAEKGYIDDSSLAVRFASELARTRLWGQKRIAQYLYTKGYKKADIDAACKSLDDAQMEENLRELIEKTAPKADLSTPKSVSAYAAKLYRLGWDWDDIKRLLAEYSEV